MKMKKIHLILALIIFATGCAASNAQHKDVMKAAKKMDGQAANQQDYFNLDKAIKEQEEQRIHDGSLWVDSYSSHLYDNMYRAAKVGDSVMIVVAEQSQGQGTGDTKTSGKSTQTNSIDNLGGLMTKLQSLLTGLDPSKLIGASSESKFDGKGDTNRTGKLNAKMTATVSHVLKNGNMVIRGEQHIKVNKEEQVLIVEGIIRPYDILPNNTVLSSSIADARITYSGFGVVADKQSPGWLVRVLDHIWPF